MKRRSVYVSVAAVGIIFSSCKKKNESTVKSDFFSDPNCQTSVPSEAQLALQSAIKATIEQMVSKQITPDQRDQAINAAIQKAGQGDANKMAVAKALAATQIQMEATDRAMPVLLKYMSSKSLSNDDLAAVTDPQLGMAPNEFLAKISVNFKPFYQCMVDAGGKVNDDGSWNITGAKINLELMQSSPCLRTAVGIFFSGAYASPDTLAKREAIFVGDSVIQVCKDLPVVSKADWNSNFKRRMTSFNNELASYLSASGQSASYTEMMRGGNSWWKDSSTSGGSAARIDAEGSYKAATGHFDAMACYGIKADMRIQLRNLMFAANKQDAANIEAGLHTLTMAEYAAVAALATPVIIAATPIIGSSLALSQGVLAASAAKVALMSMAFGVGLSATLHSVTDTANYGGNFFCRFAENLATNGSSGLVMTSFMSLLPLSTVAAGTGTALYTGSAALGTNVYGLSNVVAALGFIGYGGYNSVNEVQQCRKLLTQSIEISKTAENAEDVGRANALINQAQKLCIQGGIDIFFTVRGGLEFYKTAKNALGSNTEAEMMCLGGEACSINAKPKFNDAVTNSKAMALKTLKIFTDLYSNASINLGKVTTKYAVNGELGESMIIETDAVSRGTVQVQLLTTPQGGYRGFKVISSSVESAGKYTSIVEFADPAAAFEIKCAIDAVNTAKGSPPPNMATVKVKGNIVDGSRQSLSMPLLSKIVAETNNRVNNPDGAPSTTSLTKPLAATTAAPDITGFMEKPQTYQTLENYLGDYDSGMIKVNSDVPYWQRTGGEPNGSASFTIKVTQMFGNQQTFKNLTTQLYQASIQNAKNLLAKYPGIQKVTIDAGEIDGTQPDLRNILKGLNFTETRVNAAANSYSFDVPRT